MAIQHNQPNQDKRRPETPDLQNNPDAEASAELFSADAADDIGQLSSEAYPFSETLSAEVGLHDENAAQHGGSGPRIDDLGIDDLVNENPEEGDLDKNLSTLHELDKKDMPLFDQSMENRNPDEPDGKNPTPRNIKRTETGEDDSEGENSTLYDVSLDGPGTEDLR